MLCFKERSYCASPNCQNECGRKMTYLEKEQLKELAFKGLNPTKWISWGYFCEEPEENEQ